MKKQPIKVLQVIGSLGLGGAQNCLKHIVENKSEQVEYYIYPLRSKPANIKIEGDILSFDYLNYDIRKLFTLIRLCKKYDIDVIHAHLDKPVIAGLLATFFCSVKVVAHEHGPIFTNSFKNKVFRVFIRMLQHRADKFIAVSNAAAEQLIKKLNIPKEKITVVYNAVELDKFQPNSETRLSLRRQLDINDNKTVIGFIGRLSHLKGPDILLEAFKLLAEKNENFMLAYLGDGEMKQSLVEKAASLGLSDQVRFLGYRQDVADVINIFDIAAITSRQDAFPLTPLELLSMKVPLVSCNVYGLAEVVKNGVNAMVPEKNEQDYIAECIQKLAGDAGLRQRLTQAGTETAKRFGVDVLVQSIEEIYKQLYE